MQVCWSKEITNKWHFGKFWWFVFPCCSVSLHRKHRCIGTIRDGTWDTELLNCRNLINSLQMWKIWEFLLISSVKVILMWGTFAFTCFSHKQGLYLFDFVYFKVINSLIVSDHLLRLLWFMRKNHSVWSLHLQLILWILNRIF